MQFATVWSCFSRKNIYKQLYIMKVIEACRCSNVTKSLSLNNRGLEVFRLDMVEVFCSVPMDGVSLTNLRQSARDISPAFLTVKTL